VHPSRPRAARIRRSLRFRQGGLAAFPDQQDLPGAVQRRGGLSLDPGEGFTRPPLDARDACHRVAGRESVAEPRREKQVADPDIGAVRQEGQVHARHVADAERDGPQTIAVELDGRGVARVADQDRLRAKRVDANDLADDAVGVQERLAGVHAGLFAAIQGDPVPVRIEVDREDLRDLDPVGESCRGFHQRPEPRVFRLQRGHLLQARLLAQALRPELAILRDQAVALGEIFARPAEGGRRHVDEDADRVDGDREGAACGLQVALLVVEQHERDGQHDQQHRAGAERGSALEQRLVVSLAEWAHGRVTSNRCLLWTAGGWRGQRVTRSRTGPGRARPAARALCLRRGRHR
jgi:hypothetical protein